MLTVLPIQSKNDQETICLKCGVPFRPECMAYEARVNDQLVGICQFNLSGGVGHITDFAEYLPQGAKSDTEALFIMARGCLNFIDLCGVHHAFFDADFPNEDNPAKFTVCKFVQPLNASLPIATLLFVVIDLNDVLP